jgi:hypothetical protein
MGKKKNLDASRNENALNRPRPAVTACPATKLVTAGTVSGGSDGSAGSAGTDSCSRDGDDDDDDDEDDGGVQ